KTGATDAVGLENCQPVPPLLDRVEERGDCLLVGASGSGGHHAASSRATSYSSAAWGAAAGARTSHAATKAPTTRSPASRTSAVRKPSSSAAGSVRDPVAADAIAVVAAIPIAPPIWRLVLIRPDATPASAAETPASPAIVTGTNASAIPAPPSRKPGKRSQK